jgi:hypothetical protein
MNLSYSLTVGNALLVAFWDDPYFMDRMSQVALTPSPADRQGEGGIRIAATSEYAKFRSAVESVAAFVSPGSVLPMLDELIHEQIQKELTQLSARPDWLRGQLSLRGDAITAELLVKNRDSVAGTAYVCETFGIPRSTLHREKDAGKVIAYRPRKDAEFVFPLEQFEKGGALPWAAEIVEAVGNGAPAIHFLYVPREQLGGVSFADTLHAVDGPDTREIMQAALTRLTRNE